MFRSSDYIPANALPASCRFAWWAWTLRLAKLLCSSMLFCFSVRIGLPARGFGFGGGRARCLAAGSSFLVVPRGLQFARTFLVPAGLAFAAPAGHSCDLCSSLFLRLLSISLYYLAGCWFIFLNLNLMQLPLLLAPLVSMVLSSFHLAGYFGFHHPAGQESDLQGLCAISRCTHHSFPFDFWSFPGTSLLDTPQSSSMYRHVAFQPTTSAKSFDVGPHILSPHHRNLHIFPWASALRSWSVQSHFSQQRHAWSRFDKYRHLYPGLCWSHLFSNWSVCSHHFSTGSTYTDCLHSSAFLSKLNPNLRSFPIWDTP